MSAHITHIEILAFHFHMMLTIVPGTIAVC